MASLKRHIISYTHMCKFINNRFLAKFSVSASSARYRVDRREWKRKFLKETYGILLNLNTDTYNESWVIKALRSMGNLNPTGLQIPRALSIIATMKDRGRWSISRCNREDFENPSIKERCCSRLKTHFFLHHSLSPTYRVIDSESVSPEFLIHCGTL